MSDWLHWLGKWKLMRTEFRLCCEALFEEPGLLRYWSTPAVAGQHGRLLPAAVVVNGYSSRGVTIYSVYQLQLLEPYPGRQPTLDVTHVWLNVSKRRGHVFQVQQDLVLVQ